MSLLILNADDFGYSAGVNHGIIDAYRHGVLTSTTLMANMPGFESAVHLAKENPGLGVGVHLVLTCGSPVLFDVPSISDEDGAFKKLSCYEAAFQVDEREVYREWKAQIDRVLASGISPDHLDSHHHVNTLPRMRAVYERLAREYALPVRNNYDLPVDLRTTHRLDDVVDRLGWMKPMWKAMSVRNLIHDIKRAGSVEAICHPGYIDAELDARSSLTTGRAYTARELQRAEYAALFEAESITVGTFRDLSDASSAA